MGSVSGSGADGRSSVAIGLDMVYYRAVMNRDVIY
jgi:hypothetical protein